MAAEVSGMAKARDLGADRVELYTEPYAAAFLTGGDEFKRVLEKYVHAADRADECELGVNAGHDLNLQNLPPLVRAIEPLCEVSIGHALIGDALEFGMGETVKRYLRACGGAT
jgi:pyridoxine 5-phosphate synthase